MKKYFFIIFLFISVLSYSQQKNIHVFVALCDNEFQAIAQVPEFLGNGKDIKNNLYWGAAYGIKNYFKNKTTDWDLVSEMKSTSPNILERLLFKHKTMDVYMLADAYDGEKIKDCLIDFLKASNGQFESTIVYDTLNLEFGGKSDLLAYIGHDGLMDFDVNPEYKASIDSIDVIILACYSKKYFSPHIKKAKANPLLWTTHLMAPEAYTLKSAIDGWLENEAGPQIEERAAQTYNKYQKCGIKGARNLFTTGF